LIFRKGGSMDIKLEGKKLTIQTEVTEGTVSSSGKSMVVATTNGFVGVPDSDLKVSINVIKPRR